jgi:mRNA-degrading endonuclease RelE of RelBE toxin-antitoxin system
MRYHIEISPSAQKEIGSLPGYVRAQATELIDSLADNPRPSRARELRDRRNIYRVWLATRWRIVYEIDDELQTVLIMRVRRKEQIDCKNL